MLAGALAGTAGLALIAAAMYYRYRRRKRVPGRAQEQYNLASLSPVYNDSDDSAVPLVLAESGSRDGGGRGLPTGAGRGARKWETMFGNNAKQLANQPAGGGPTCKLPPSAAPKAGYQPRAVQFHPSGGQLDFVRPPARTMHPHGAYVW